MLDKRVTSATKEASILTDVVDVRVDDIQAEVNLLKRVVGRDEDCAPMSKAARIPEAEKVSITSIYLIGDVKLWWRTRLSDDASANWDKIEMWDVLKKELKDQFLPAILRGLQGKSTGNRNMQTWAHGVERRQKRKGKILVRKKGNLARGGRMESLRKEAPAGNGVGKQGDRPTNVDRTKKVVYLCNGDHRMRDCPKRGKLNALVAEADDDEGGSTRVNPLQLKLGLTLAQHSSRIKAVNSEAKPIQGVVCVELKDSIRSAKKKDSLMSAMQVKAGLRHGEQTYLAALIEVKPDVVQEVLDKVAEFLKEFKDVFPPELPNKMPPTIEEAIGRTVEAQAGPAVQSTVWFSYSVPNDGLGIPSKMADLRSFFGLVNLLQRFIKDTRNCNPLKDLLRKDQSGSDICLRRCIQVAEQAISSQSVMIETTSVFDKPFEVAGS
ncbi:hypothetical protein Sango_2997000 [Sesamum angolense]|uniref:Reverse transcriptase domain-containing protein n=1 Tax=Sesamum angolense TaxID=2727404 RepID=A0AAE1T3G8_9LAMI|nr:hypothetical protein Sango_2997000 [Sesamum angolense]